MILEEAFNLIRSEQVIIWAGAGFSLYAGYPDAKSLGEIIINSLPIEFRGQFQRGQSLNDLCEQHIKISGNDRKPLLKILKQAFNKKPRSIEFHEKLCIIPHIQTIITTNYDPLFEEGYGNKIQVIADSKELKSLSNELLP